MEAEVADFGFDAGAALPNAEFGFDDSVHALPAVDGIAACAPAPADETEFASALADENAEVVAAGAEAFGSAGEDEVAEEEAGPGVAAAEGAEAEELANCRVCHFVHAGLAVDAQFGRERFDGELAIREAGEGVREGSEIVAAEGEAGGHLVPAEALEQVGGLRDGGVEVEAVDASARAVESPFVFVEKDGWAVVLADQP